jgi:Sec-independent protein secretion pathway component TatC
VVFQQGPLAFSSWLFLAGAFFTFFPTTPFHDFYWFSISKQKSHPLTMVFSW